MENGVKLVGAGSARPSAILALGGNIGDTVSVFRNVLNHLRTNAVIDIQAVSHLYRSRSLLLDQQGDYLNIAIVGHVTLEPLPLLNILQHVERVHGRTTSARWGERVIDIDIIDMNGMVYSDDRLALPHAMMQNRSFVLLPMMDIVPDYHHPVTGLGLREMYDALKEKLDIIDLGLLNDFETF